jgi:hypothetical protein
MMKINIKQTLIYLSVAFVIVTIWQSPTDTGQAVSSFLSATGDWIGQVAGKFADFWDGLFEGS